MILDNLTKYWQYTLQQQSIAEFVPLDLTDGIAITIDECRKAQVTTDRVQHFTSKPCPVVIFPVCAVKQDYLLPVAFNAVLQPDGQLQVNELQPWPVVSNSVLAEYNSKCCFGTEQDYVNGLAMLEDCALQLDNSYHLLEQITDGKWQNILLEQGFHLLPDIMMYPLELVLQKSQHYSNYTSLANVSDKLTEKLANVDIENVNEYTDEDVIANAQNIVNDCVAGECHVVAHCSRSSGKTKIATEVIDKFWIKAAVEGVAFPNIVWIDNKQMRLPSIFANDTSWLSADEIATIQKGKFNAAGAKGNIIQQFLAKCGSDSLVEAKTQLHNQLLRVHEQFTECRAVAENYKRKKSLQKKKSKYDNLALQQHDLSKQLQTISNKHKRLQALRSLWRNKLQRMPFLLKCFSSMPIANKYIQRVANEFFAEYLAQEGMHNLSIAEINVKLDHMIEKTNTQEQVVSSMLLEVKQQLDALDQAKLAYQQVLQKYGYQHCEVEEFYNNLAKFHNELLIITQHYWETVLLLDTVWENNYQRTEIDLLIIEHAENYPWSKLAPLMVRAKQMLVMGDLQKHAISQIPEIIDHTILANSKLIADDEEFEDLAYLGLAASRNNVLQTCSNIASKLYLLNGTFEQNPMITNGLNQLHSTKIINFNNCNDRDQNSLLYWQVVGTMQRLQNSYFNVAEAQAIGTWLALQDNAIDKVVIVTTMVAQQQALLRLCGMQNMPIKVELLSNMSYKSYPIVLFSPVYSKLEGNYIFDCNDYMYGLFSKAINKLIVFGQAGLFNPKFHSPSGKVAKLFKVEKYLTETTNSVLET